MFCTDTDLLVIDADIFEIADLADFRRTLDYSATLTGTTLTLASGSWTAAGALPGMVVTLMDTTGTFLRHAELVVVTDSSHATISVPRALASDAAVPPAANGVAKARLISFLPQIAAISAQLMGLLGVDTARDQALPAVDHGASLRSAAVMGTLATLYRAAGPALAGKAALYAQAYAALRRAVSARVDLDGDGVAETRRNAGIRKLVRS
jgi:hypothetical protein